jgi:hypothetical protein
VTIYVSVVFLHNVTLNLFQVPFFS